MQFALLPFEPPGTEQKEVQYSLLTGTAFYAA